MYTHTHKHLYTYTQTYTLEHKETNSIWLSFIKANCNSCVELALLGKIIYVYICGPRDMSRRSVMNV